MQKNNPLSRRDFLKSSATIGAIGVVGGIPLLSSCSSAKKEKEAKHTLPQFLDQAPDGKVIKAGLIGCGGRGTGAAVDFLNAGTNLQIIALGDVFQDKMDVCRVILKTEKNVEIPDENWVNFCWLSGDHITEQFIHEVDVMNWYFGQYPTKATGWGGRQRRVTGDQYDFFSVEYLYENGMRSHCAARQIDGCTNEKVEQINCSQGYADAAGKLYDLKGNMIWEYPHPEENDTQSEWNVNNPYIQEHINFVTAIRTGNTLNDGEDQAYSSLVTIMGRMAAYTGKDVTWDEVLNADLYLGSKTYDMGKVEGISETIPVVGVSHVG